MGVVAASGGGSASSSAGLATKKKPGKVALTKQKPKGFSPRDVLMDSDGNVIGGGDGPEAEGAAEFFAWLEERGCLGLGNVMLRLSGGVLLRACAGIVPKGGDLFTVPRAAWIEAEARDEEELEEALAWRLLEEAWKGSESEYEPFVQQLRRKDVSAHPVMWTAQEVDWIRVSPEGFEAVNEKREETEKRVASLAARARAQPAGLVPEQTLADEEALAQEARWALALVEACGTELEDPESGSISVAFIPMMGEVRNTFSKQPPTYFEVTGKRALLRTTQLTRPGNELLQKLPENLSGARLLADMGVVPGAERLGVPSDMELLEMNEGSTVKLQILPLCISDFPPEACVDMKLALIEEYAGLQLAEPRLPSTPVSRTSFTLPIECTGRGRLLPVARFLVSGIEAMPGKTQDWMKRYFVKYFKSCKFDRYPPVDEELQKADAESINKTVFFTYELDVEARSLICGWLETNIILYSEAIDRAAGETGLPNGSSGGVILVEEGQLVLSHFKAKRKDGTTGKSRTPREARVLAQTETSVRLEFLSNGRRHEVPGTWIVGSTPVPSAGLLQSGISPEKVARARLAITLLRTERAILGFYLSQLRRSVEILQGTMKKAQEFSEAGDEVKARACAMIITDFLESEAKELDATATALLPPSLDRIPELGEDGMPMPLSDPNKPVWDMPPVSTLDDNAALRLAKDLFVLDEEAPAGKLVSSEETQEKPKAAQGE